MFIDSQLGRRIHGRPEFRLDARSLVCRLLSTAGLNATKITDPINIGMIRSRLREVA